MPSPVVRSVVTWGVLFLASGCAAKLVVPGADVDAGGDKSTNTDACHALAAASCQLLKRCDAWAGSLADCEAQTSYQCCEDGNSCGIAASASAAQVEACVSAIDTSFACDDSSPLGVGPAECVGLLPERQVWGHICDRIAQSQCSRQAFCLDDTSDLEACFKRSHDSCCDTDEYQVCDYVMVQTDAVVEHCIDSYDTAVCHDLIDYSACDDVFDEVDTLHLIAPTPND